MATLTIEQILALLAENPTRIATLTAAVEPLQLRTRPVPDAWSANDILAHLRCCADMWGECIATILTKDKPTIRAINPTTWINKTDYPDLEFQPSFQAFTKQRQALLGILKQIPPEAWSRTATVTGAGKHLERSVHFYAQWLATHERSHVSPMERTVSSVHK